jgi:hypothetical protein
MKTTHIAFGILCAMAGFLGGCGGDYYRVNNPAGEKQYYTKEIDQTKSGAITFKDEKSGSKVTLQSSEVKNISKDEFETGIKGLSGTSVQTAPAAPAQTSGPVPVPETSVPGETTAQPIEQK